MELKEFLLHNKQNIKEDRWPIVYESAAGLLDDEQIPTLTDMLLKADVNPLEHMVEVPSMYALDLDSITSVKLPEKVEVVGYRSFLGCDNLKTLDLSNLERIEQSAFRASGLQNVKLTNVSELEKYVFAQCKELEEVELDNINTISEGCFASCDKLNKVTLKNIYYISPNAFPKGIAQVNCDDASKEAAKNAGLIG